jgi:prevent-host-death family protein
MIMIEVGVHEAKTHLSALLDKVKHEGEVLITKRGIAIARLVPAEHANPTEIGLIIDKLRLFRKKVKLRGLGWKGLRDDGRR